MLIHSLTLKNFLSFGREPKKTELSSLNVIIGPNGSGKSNLIEAIELIRNAPNEFLKPIREGGGVRDWLWKGAVSPVASIECIVDYPAGERPQGRKIRYAMDFTETAQRFELVDEKIENEEPDYAGATTPFFYYHYQNGSPVLSVKGQRRSLQREDVDFDRSILAQRRDPDQYPEITYLADKFSKIRTYREWSFGRYTLPRLSQKTDLPNDFLEPDGSNLALVLNRLRKEPLVKKDFLGKLREIFDGIEDFDVQIEGGTAQAFLQEAKWTVPATRLSDGTLRYMCLLAILLHPSPPPLICIEEPELGLHPDVIPAMANLLKEASDKTQLIVTTHSDILVNALSDSPESVIVCERDCELGTTLRRLSREELTPWLEKYRLGELWMNGEIGGARW